MLETRRPLGIDTNNRQGKFGQDYIRVLASAAGLVWMEDDVDLDGVDLCLKLPGRTPRGHSPRIDVQVKTVSRPEIRHGVLNFDGLGRTQFDRLAGPDFTVPRYLIVVHVPASGRDLAGVTPSGLVLRHIAYYLSLADHEPLRTDDRRKTIRVKVPLSNVLTVSSLRDLVTADRPIPVTAHP